MTARPFVANPKDALDLANNRGLSSSAKMRRLTDTRGIADLTEPIRIDPRRTPDLLGNGSRRTVTPIVVIA